MFGLLSPLLGGTVYGYERRHGEGVFTWVMRCGAAEFWPLITQPDTVVDIVTEAVEFVHRSDHAAAHPIVS